MFALEPFFVNHKNMIFVSHLKLIRIYFISFILFIKALNCIKLTDNCKNYILKPSIDLQPFKTAFFLSI